MVERFHDRFRAEIFCVVRGGQWRGRRREED
jgi:hypothetical protein